MNIHVVFDREIEKCYQNIYTRILFSYSTNVKKAAVTGTRQTVFEDKRADGGIGLDITDRDEADGEDRNSAERV